MQIMLRHVLFKTVVWVVQLQFVCGNNRISLPHAIFYITSRPFCSCATWKDNEFKFVCFNGEQTISSIVYVTEIFKHTGQLIVLQSENTLKA